MEVAIFIDCDNAAFEDEPEREVARILRELAAKLDAGERFDQPLYDSNGNHVGECGVY